MTIYPESTTGFTQKPYYEVFYDNAWDVVLEVLGDERVGTVYQVKEKGRIITGYFTGASEGANVQKRARWSYTITFTQLNENRTKIDIDCKIEQYLKGWGLVAYSWRDITDESGFKNIAHNLERWLYEKIEAKLKNLKVPEVKREAIRYLPPKEVTPTTTTTPPMPKKKAPEIIYVK